MSLQAIAGTAYTRRHAGRRPAPAAPLHGPGPRGRTVEAALDGGPAPAASANPASTPQAPPDPAAQQRAGAARQINGALDTLKRYIPTELLALYLPFIAITQDQFSAPAQAAQAAAVLHGIYLGFVLATPLVVLALYIVQAVQAHQTWLAADLPYFEAGLGTAAFAVWGAAVPGVFAGHQWWLGLLALASALVLPLLDAVFGQAAPAPPAPGTPENPGAAPAPLAPPAAVTPDEPRAERLPQPR